MFIDFVLAECRRSPLISTGFVVSARLAYGHALRFNSRHEIFPGFDEGLRPLVLEAGRKSVDVDSRLGETREHRLAVPAVRRQDIADLAVIPEGPEGTLRYGIDGEGRGERLHIENVGRFGILRTGAGPQQALGAGPRVRGPKPPRR